MKSRYQLALRGGPLLAGIAVFTLFAVQSAPAASGAFNYGEVIDVRGCSQIFVIAEGNAFSIIEVVGGPQIEQMDVLAGDLGRVGLTTVLDTSRNNAQLNVIVLDSLLSRTQYNAQLAHYCHR